MADVMRKQKRSFRSASPARRGFRVMANIEELERALRAAFNAGITPARIARQFGISQSNVRKALATDEPKG
jgi:DNA-binding transcriptional regulator LsrR (DeoR family)